MRTAMFYLGGLLLATTAPLAAEQPAPAGAGYAVLVGVCEYEHAGLPPLSYAENDVEALARELDRPGSPFHKRVRLLTTSRGQKNAADRPTAANVKAAVDRALAERTRQETVLVALAGHGSQLLVPDPDGKGEDRSYGYFFPADAQLAGMDYRTGRSARLVLLPELLQQLGDCGASNKLLLMDACRNQLRLKQRSLTVRQDMVPEGVAALFSCKPGEVSYEAEKLRHGVFFHFLLEGLRGKAKNRRGEVTWARLAEYVTEKVTEDAATLIGEKVVQTPNLLANLAGRSPVLALGDSPAGRLTDIPVTNDKRGADEPASDVERLYRRGLELYQGTGGTVNRPEAARLFRRAAEEGHGPAQMARAVQLVVVAGRGRTDAEAVAWAEKGLAATRRQAEAGDPHAQSLLGYAYRFGLGVGRDEAVAVNWYRKAVEQGNACGQYNLGLCYQFGLGVDKDEVVAVSWFRKAAEQGNAFGQHLLAGCYADGRGVTKDETMAATWIRKAAVQGDDAAQNSLGWRCHHGRGVEKDEKEAVSWFRKSAAQGDSLAQYNLGLCYKNGRGIAKDEVEAVSWFHKAADQQHMAAQNTLGWCYENGRGVAQNMDLAKHWYRKAADQGYAAARQRLKELE